MPIRTIKELREHLQSAVELEHSTIPPYLCALYTIVPGTNQDSIDVIRSVVVEEMLHMTLSSNVLNAVGGSPNIDQPNFIPEYPTYLPDGETDFKVGLLKFSQEAIDTFLKIELPSKPKHRKSDEMPKRSPGHHVMAMGDTYSTVGEFYDEIKEGIRRLVKEHGEQNVFTGDPRLQISPDFYYASGGGVITVHDQHSAEKALSVVIDQGEGLHHSIFDGDHKNFGQPREVAHYFRFQEIKLGRYYKLGDRPGHPTGPPLEVNWDAAYNMAPNPKTAEYPEGSQVRRASQEFNRLYTRFLKQLHDAFNGHPELLIPAVTGMFDIKYAALELINNPFPGREGVNAGPAFEYAAS